MILVSVRFHGATETQGSRWTATMSRTMASDGKIRKTVAYDYSGDGNNGQRKAVIRALEQWEREANFKPHPWTIEMVGQDHNGDYIWAAHQKDRTDFERVA